MEDVVVEQEQGAIKSTPIQRETFAGAAELMPKLYASG